MKPRALLWTLCAVLGACASYGRPLDEIAPSINASLYMGPTIVEPGDMLELKFAHKAEWNQTVRVRGDGCVAVPVFGDLRVAGFTLPELQRTLEERYAPVLVEPDLSINLTDLPTAGTESGGGIVISGEVTRPGQVGLRGERLTLVEALARAGGHLKATALLGNTLLMRRSPKSGLYTAWRIDARDHYWGIAEPVYLQRHDLVFVPNTPIDNVDIWVDQYINKMLPVGVASFALGIVVGGR